MIVNIDGYDGTGKTTLARRIASERGFVYIEKPFILKYSIENNCSMKEAKEKTSLIETELYRQGDKQKLIDFYCDGIIWLIALKDKMNVVLDRGILTTYAVFGSSETKSEFVKYLKQGIAFDLSIYLTADDLERRKRIILNDPNDPDLKYPIEWRKNDLEEFAQEQKINYVKIETDGVDKEGVVMAALEIIDHYPNSIITKTSNAIKKLGGLKNEISNN